MLENPSSLSFRGAAGDEESRPSFDSGARFLPSLGMTTLTDVFSILLGLQLLIPELLNINVLEADLDSASGVQL
jgi:hypothetical protein